VSFFYFARPLQEGAEIRLDRRVLVGLKKVTVPIGHVLPRPVPELVQSRFLCYYEGRSRGSLSARSIATWALDPALWPNLAPF
jgi:hypothetical protein